MLISRFKDVLPWALVFILGCWCGFLVGKSQAPPIIMMAQKDAATTAGAQAGLNAAGIPAGPAQAKEVAQGIATAAKKPPEYITTTTAKNLPVAVETERKNNNADVALLTDPANPEQTFSSGALGAVTPIQLNQYNIHAYKPILRELSYAPKSDGSPRDIRFSVSKKITKGGKYLGVGVGHWFPSHTTYGAVTYGW